MGYSFWFKVWGIFFITLFFIEIIFYSFGFEPGYFEQRNSNGIEMFRKVDSLFILPNFYADKDGIMKLRDIKHKSQDEWYINKLYKNYIYDVNLNEFGFRTRSFTDTVKSKGEKRILFLGDSFTFGYSAVPVSNSFVDLIEKNEKFKTYNLGVPGSGPLTYYKVLKNHINDIKPDYIVVNLFLGNDFIPYNKTLAYSEFNDLYPTNAGGLNRINFETIDSDSIEVFENSYSAYNFIINKISLFNDKNIFAILSSKLNISTQLYKVLYTKERFNDNCKISKYAKNDITSNVLNDILVLGEEHECKTIFIAIPSKTQSSKISDIQKELETKLIGCKSTVLIVPNLIKDDYSNVKYDGHFNNLGHAKYAKFIIENL